MIFENNIYSDAIKVYMHYNDMLYHPMYIMGGGYAISVL